MADPNAFAQLDPQAAQPLNPAATPPSPPQSPEELQQRVSGWQTVLDRISSDPSLIAGIARFATQAMQPVAPGGNVASHLAGALEHSIDYVAASRQQATEAARKNAVAQAEIEQRRAQTGAVTQETKQKEIAFPNAMAQAEEKLKQAQNENSKAKYELQSLAAQEAAGLMGPEFAKRKSDAEMRLKESTAAMYDAHANYYNMLGKAGADKAAGVHQILHTTKLDNPDGTSSIITTHAVNGKMYMESYTPPRFTDPVQARLQAQKEVDKITPFFGQAPYTGTKAQEIERRVQMYTTPQRSIIGPGATPLTPQQFEALQQPQGTAAPGPRLGPREKAIQGAAVVTPEEQASDQAVGGLHADNSPESLAELRATIASTKNPRIRAILEQELAAQTGATATAGTGGGKPIPVSTLPPKSSQPIPVTRDANGQLRLAGAETPPPPTTPVAPKGPTPAEIAENPKLAQTSPAERAAKATQEAQTKKDRRQALDARIPNAKTPKQKMQLFVEYSDVMTPEERRKYASGRQ